MSKHFRLSSLLLAAAFVAACAPAAQPTTAPSEPTADLDAAVNATVQAIQTRLVADLTAQAPLASPTGPAEGDTPTPVPAVATFPPTPTNFVVIFPTTVPANPPGGGGGGAVDPPKFACSIVAQTPENGSLLAAKTDFDAIWTIKNTGTKLWDVGLIDIFFSSGTPMHQYADAFDLTTAVGSGKTVKVRVDMVAPKTPGTYSTFWAVKVDGDFVFCTLSLIIKVK